MHSKTKRGHNYRYICRNRIIPKCLGWNMFWEVDARCSAENNRKVFTCKHIIYYISIHKIYEYLFNCIYVVCIKNVYLLKTQWPNLCPFYAWDGRVDIKFVEVPPHHLFVVQEHKVHFNTLTRDDGPLPCQSLGIPL